MGSIAVPSPLFVDALRAAESMLNGLTVHELSSWVVARLSYLTCGGIDRQTSSDDTNEFGFKIKITDAAGESVAHGAVVIGNNRLVYSAHNIRVVDSQLLFVTLLSGSPRDLAICEVEVREPESRRRRTYGWDGRMLLS